MKQIINRIYTEFFMRSYLPEYEAILLNALKHGYQFISVCQYSNLIQQNLLSSQKIIVLRHDVDVNINIARRMYDIEQKYNIESTYYFRLVTMDNNLIQYMLRNNTTEISYHYEEIAQFCKDNNITNKEEILARIPEIETNFLEHYTNFKNKYKLQLKTVASHGDFINRQLNIANHYLLNSQDLRDKTNIVHESYDKELLDTCNIYIADRPYKLNFHPVSLDQAIDEGNQVIYLLIHPENWIGSLKFGAINVYSRIQDGIKWKFF